MADKPKRRRPQSGGALLLIAGCFGASAVLRVALVGPMAIAQVAAAAPEEPAAAICGDAAGADAMLEAIRERGTQLDRRETEMAERRAVLDIAEREFDRKYAALVEAETRLAATVALADGAAERDLAQLTAIYENMKPKRAAGIFDSMDASFAAGALGRMNPQAAADILTLMDAEKAYAISVLMAARNMNAGGEPALD